MSEVIKKEILSYTQEWMKIEIDVTDLNWHDFMKKVIRLMKAIWYHSGTIWEVLEEAEVE